MGVKYKIILHKQALKDIEKLKQVGLASKAKMLLERIGDDPFINPPPYEKLQGSYSRRINIQHRLVYSVDEERKEIRVARLWTHYA